MILKQFAAFCLDLVLFCSVLEYPMPPKKHSSGGDPKPTWRPKNLSDDKEAQSPSSSSAAAGHKDADKKERAERNQLACCLQGSQAGRQIAAA